ncbi:hypothetical protein HX049_02670 [Myroides odoratimimus]|uniref:hypothetical protein n=1 Tax=Myroides odoratimimus TaxID=76832 RepID=UPI0025772956|nr:hypothetical protein [Myroides odoratimimus]MDM1396084.1 hypothetical protein [Myroides odoratimimus]
MKENSCNNQEPSVQIDQSQIGKAIGRHKYAVLKSKPKEELTGIELHQIEVYEARGKLSAESAKKMAAYFEMIRRPKVEKIITFTAKELYDAFQNTFNEMYGKKYELTEESLDNLSPLIYYFSKDERFFECKNLSRASKPSFEKGLLVIGGYGNGKTSCMKVFEKLMRPIKGKSFKGYTANEVVTMFEKCKEDSDRSEFEDIMYKGQRYFDDLKTERIASNYGKVNIFKEILEERYIRQSRTFVTSNYKENHPNDLKLGIEEFGEKYGDRVYDRIFEMFNIIEFKGQSFRK